MAALPGKNNREPGRMLKGWLKHFSDRQAKPGETGAFFGVISLQPLVIQYLGGEPGVLLTLHQALEGRNLWILRAADWAEEKATDASRWAAHERRVRRRWPKHGYAFLCSSPGSLSLFRRAGLRAVLCSHNALLDETQYRVLEGAEKKFDAIYNAQVAPFKRLQLASAVTNLAILTYRTWAYPKNFVSMKKKLHKASWLNFDRGDFRWLDTGETVSRLNSARVGLMLSAIEGANFASVEYFLCGLPLVTTPSIGGREAFYDDRYVRVVEPDPELIATAVLQMCERKVDPQMIRAKTLDIMEGQRRNFRQVLDEICLEAGEGGSGQEIWERNFFNKFTRWMSIDDLLETL